jgi:DNA phosphorothioation-associated putative methyltransferase
LADGLIGQLTEVLDYGCGLGSDVRLLNEAGVESRGWDPIHAPDGDRSPAEVVNLGYVVNVIEDSAERAAVLQDAWSRAERLLIVAARLRQDEQNPAWLSLNDGVLTRIGTFQKYYEQRELREWIDGCLGLESVAAAPGVFYVFRNEGDRFSFIASRFRRRLRVPRTVDPFKGAKDVLEPLMSFVEERGRLPYSEEALQFPDVIARFGSLKRAFLRIRRATGAASWESVEKERSEDLGVHLALSRFGRRPKFSSLSRSLQYDIRAFFGTYAKACRVADELLFRAGKRDEVDLAARDAPAGKKTPTSLYVHVTALDVLASVLRVYEGCARVLTGHLEGANVIKLHRDKPAVSYLWYPTFEEEAHPTLAGAFIVYLDTLQVRYRDYSIVDNPPILHRKEEFVTADHPHREMFSSLTAKEVELGLYENPAEIGTRNGWAATLAAKRAAIRGHEVFGDCGGPGTDL